MDKKQFTSWGVSFGSLALVAGMVSYLGLTNKDTTNKANSYNQSPAAAQNSIQQAPSQNGDSQNSLGNSASDNGTSSSFGDDQATNDNGSSSSFGDDQATTDSGSSLNFRDDQSTNDSGPSLFDNGSPQQNDNQSSGQSSFGHHGRFDTTTGGT